MNFGDIFSVLFHVFPFMRHDTAPPEIDVCTQPRNFGPCLGMYRRLWYNERTERCEEFWYGGCGGNENNFQTLADCLKRCGPKKEETTKPTEEQPNAAPPLPPPPSEQQPSEEHPIATHLPPPQPEDHQEQDPQTMTQDEEQKEEPEPKDGEKSKEEPTEVTETTDGLQFRVADNNGEEQENNEKRDASEEEDKKVEDKISALAAEVPAVAVIVDKCDQPKQSGKCRAMYQRYWYNNETAKCEQFVYGGCEANENNFEHEEECVKECVKNVEETNPQEGPITTQEDAPVTSETSSETDPATHQIDSNEDEERKVETLRLQQSTIAELKKTSKESSEEASSAAKTPTTTTIAAQPRPSPTLEQVCRQPKAPGTCEDTLVRFWYNAEADSCEQFAYTGCGGNENSFHCEHDCMKMCARIKDAATQTDVAEPAVPASEPEPEPQPEPKPEPEPDTGNDVDVDPMQLKKIQTHVCHQPRLVGPCRASKTRFWYNGATKRCESFIYGGCRGNDNNFVDEKECVITCVTTDLDNNNTSIFKKGSNGTELEESSGGLSTTTANSAYLPLIVIAPAVLAQLVAMRVR